MNKVKKLVQYIRKNDKDKSIQIGFSNIIYRADRDLEKKIMILTTNWKDCPGNGFIFVDNSAIFESCLNNGKLLLNKKGSSMQANNIKSPLKEICWISQSHANKSDTTKTYYSHLSNIVT